MLSTYVNHISIKLGKKFLNVREVKAKRNGNVMQKIWVRKIHVFSQALKDIISARNKIKKKVLHTGKGQTVCAKQIHIQ